ncbi:GspE/PulE family protein [Schlegelella sp. S2-27]|uniref:GspE/PulE family protein n=1 Tax=Caldimonas mangrovi TaxID=2944811 RepID=A0ABT0YS59_9BURK|nr:GspE/PulE family protein [Caldimonas mangrovi]MCM5681567.1 GspE/PulE family protein [Caldimonas mangrovi]
MSSTSISLDEIRAAVGALQNGGPSVQEALADLEPRAGRPAMLAEALALECDSTDLTGWRPDFARIAYTVALARGVAAATRETTTALLITDPSHASVLNWAQSQGPVLKEVLVDPGAFKAWLSAYEATAVAQAAAGKDEPLTPGPTKTVLAAEELSADRLEATTSSVVRLVNATLYEALRSGASDIHVETDPRGLVIKYRLDGVLRQVREAKDPLVAEQVISRLKVMSELDIAERRVPQDGRLQVQMQGRTIDVRVSIMPSIHGEDAVLRILDRQHLAQSLQELTLAGLGFEAELAGRVLRLARRPHGMVLVTGPTGSGKTTTLYAAINESCSTQEKVITIEDPVEYQLPGVLQIPVNERKGLSFARGLRSILRHDPDKILVGEIRDGETARIAVQAALTGHLVFTTVHANDALDVLGRFQQFEIDRYSVAAALNGVLAQRLVRRLCACAQPAAAPSGHEQGSWRQANGCPACLDTGYRGRFAIGELLVMSTELKAMIVDHAPYQEVWALARRQGLRTLREQAMDAASKGWTSFDEVQRVTAEV